MGADEMKQLWKYKDNLLEKNKHPFHKKNEHPKNEKNALTLNSIIKRSVFSQIYLPTSRLIDTTVIPTSSPTTALKSSI